VGATSRIDAIVVFFFSNVLPNIAVAPAIHAGVEAKKSIQYDTRCLDKAQNATA
jgi:hypothetical protein